MKKYLKKKNGFTLIEVVISMAIIAIVSVGVYNAYMLLIKQTKVAEIRQTASLEGRRLIEEIKSTIEDDKFTVTDEGKVLHVGEKVFNIESDVFTRYLDENYHETEGTLAKYIERITLKESVVELDENQFIEEATTSAVSYKFYIGKYETNNGAYIKYNSQIKDLKEYSNQITLNVYFYENLNMEKSIIFKDFDGEMLLPTITTTSAAVDLLINFSEYNSEDSSSLSPVQINTYNQTTIVPNIYMEKDSLTNAYVNPCKGAVNIYDNRTGDLKNVKIGTLYDIQVEITNNAGNSLFTGNAKQNIKKDLIAK